jgi:hypothetical protein
VANEASRPWGARLQVDPTPVGAGTSTLKRELLDKHIGQGLGLGLDA